MSQSEESDSELRELLAEDSREVHAAASAVPPPLAVSAEQYIILKKHFEDICEQVYLSLPEEPAEDTPEYILYLYYYSVQFVIVYYRLDGKPMPDFINDTDDIIREKAYVIHLHRCYRKCLTIIEQLAQKYNMLLRSKIQSYRQGGAQRALWLLDQLMQHKELHSRRIKSDPAATRKKTDKIQKAFNLITDEQYNHENDDHKSWRILIINPLPTDFDINAIDPKEGGKTHELALQVEKLKGQSNLPEPFSVIVSTEWDKLLKVFHVLHHFEDYMHTYLAGCIDLDQIQNMNRQETWNHLFGAHKDVPIKNLSREKKKTPQIVSRTAELRDFIICALAFV